MAARLGKDRDISKEAAMQQDCPPPGGHEATKEEIADTDFSPLVRRAIRGGISGEGHLKFVFLAQKEPVQEVSRLIHCVCLTFTPRC